MKKTRYLSLLSAGGLLSLAAACGGSDDGPAAPAPPPAPSGKLKVSSDVATTRANDLRGVVFAASGKVYVSGHTGSTAVDRQTVIGRFNADGTPDSTFGTGGFVTINVVPKDGANTTSTGDEQSSGIVELANGDLIVAVNAADNNGGAPITDGTTTLPRPEGASVMLLRLNSSGAPVTSFGTSGRAVVEFGWSEADNAAWPVPTFNTAGTSLVGNGFPRDTMWNIELDPSASGASERVVVFGFGPARRAASGTQRTDSDRYVARVLASTGAADPTFNGGKAFTWDSPGSLGDNGRNGTVAPDGKIISAGYTNLGTGLGNHVVVLHLTSGGVPDSGITGIGLSPAQAGVSVLNPVLVDGGVSEAYGVGRQSTGAVVTTGYGNATAVTTPPRASTLGYQSTLTPDLVSYRLTSAGALDTTWGTAGRAVVQSEGKSRPTTEDRGRDLVVLKDDRVVEVGRYGGNAAVFVFDKNGKLDTRADVGVTEAAGAVSGDGIIELPASSVPATLFSAAISADGKRIAATTNADDAGARLVLIDLND